jgi:hypothetical protein
MTEEGILEWTTLGLLVQMNDFIAIYNTQDRGIFRTVPHTMTEKDYAADDDDVYKNLMHTDFDKSTAMKPRNLPLAHIRMIKCPIVNDNGQPYWLMKSYQPKYFLEENGKK